MALSHDTYDCTYDCAYHHTHCHALSRSSAHTRSPTTLTTEQELYATEIPNEIGSPGITPNPLLRFALSSFMLLVMSLCQWLFRWAIWDRFVEDRVWQAYYLLCGYATMLHATRYYTLLVSSNAGRVT